MNSQILVYKEMTWIRDIKTPPVGQKTKWSKGGKRMKSLMHVKNAQLQRHIKSVHLGIKDFKCDKCESEKNSLIYIWKKNEIEIHFQYLTVMNKVEFVRSFFCEFATFRTRLCIFFQAVSIQHLNAIHPTWSPVANAITKLRKKVI